MLKVSFLLLAVAILLHLLSLRIAIKEARKDNGDIGISLVFLFFGLIATLFSLAFSHSSGNGYPMLSRRMSEKEHLVKVISAETNNNDEVFIFTKDPRDNFKLYEFPKGNVLRLEFGKYHNVFERSGSKGRLISPSGGEVEIVKTH